MKNIFSNLFKKKKADVFDEIPTGVCPNCWGDQEYGNIIREKFKDAQIDVNNRESKYAFIQDFVVTHLDGIKLKSAVHGTECPTCKVKYKEEESKS
ncbi:hypothetical protein [Eudoraea adriatica]|uniref:hypothetical protein n=1 Tax=Eudoraea adriatica TaxID=446681 RepID=UPI000366CFB6|nr:hypothetical protein [Eudoraea adriatica]